MRLGRRVAEQLKFSNSDGLHDLPAIADYWSRTHLVPIFEAFGYRDQTDFMVRQLLAMDVAAPRILSIGSGDGSHDLRIAGALVAAGCSDFSYELVDSNPGLLASARAHAEAAGLAGQLRFTCSPVEALPTGSRYDAVIAIQFLHHVVALETLFEQIRGWLVPGGRFLVDDMIGRNGHMRWPEAEAEIRRLWSTLDARYKYHHLHQVVNHEFVNWDCSLTGFEGIRAQDIVPALLQAFHFDHFIAFGNLIDVFIDRPYGPNFDPGDPRDRAFIDAVHTLDEELLRSGALTPTHLVAALVTEAPATIHLRAGITPAACLRTSAARETPSASRLRGPARS
ncbi:MAG: class I SAM-dependent methyltransferase [Xanthomonadales bacterium]|nr:class I SAM-dependent methyltransferase [Xanthomonadales bacterium]